LREPCLPSPVSFKLSFFLEVPFFRLFSYPSHLQVRDTRNLMFRLVSGRFLVRRTALLSRICFSLSPAVLAFPGTFSLQLVAASLFSFFSLFHPNCLFFLEISRSAFSRPFCRTRFEYTICSSGPNSSPCSFFVWLSVD